jgi:magnesium transporter
LIRAFLFDAKGEDREVDVATGPLPHISKDRLLWIELIGRSDSDLCRLQDLLGLDARILEGFRKPNGLLILNNYGDHFHCSVIALNPSEAKKENGPPLPTGVHLDLVIGTDWLVTAQEELKFLHEFRERDRGETVIGALNSGTLAASLLDWHLTAYLTALEELEAWLDLLDVRPLASKAADMSLLKSVISSRRYVSRMRRNLAPQRAVFYGLARPDFALVSGSEAKTPSRLWNVVSTACSTRWSTVANLDGSICVRHGLMAAVSASACRP